MILGWDGSDAVGISHLKFHDHCLGHMIWAGALRRWGRPPHCLPWPTLIPHYDPMPAQLSPSSPSQEA